MTFNGGLVVLISVVCAAGGWLYLRFRRLRQLENKEIIEEAYGDAKKVIDNKSLQSLVDDSNKRASKRH